MRNLTETVKHLIIINIIFFVAKSFYGELMIEWLGLWFPKSHYFGVWQLLTHMFMHGGLMHIFFNMYALYAFGAPLEMMWGKNKFIFFYLSAGIGAALIHTLSNYISFEMAMSAIENSGQNAQEVLDYVVEHGAGYRFNAPDVESLNAVINSPAVGASGAIYGILVAFGMAYPNTRLFMIFIPVPIKAKYFIPAIIAIDLYSGLTGSGIFGSGIAHFAHVGGALFGFIMAWYWKKNSFNNHRWD